MGRCENLTNVAQGRLWREEKGKASRADTRGGELEDGRGEGSEPLEEKQRLQCVWDRGSKRSGNIVRVRCGGRRGRLGCVSRVLGNTLAFPFETGGKPSGCF